MAELDRNARDGGASEQAVRVARSFVSLADTLVDDFDVVELLDHLVRSCVELIGVSAAGIMLLNDQRNLEVVASSDETSRLMDLLQVESRSGPCVEAVLTGEPVSALDAREMDRWPALATALAEVGYVAVHALPMRLRRDTVGALNLFVTRQQAVSAFDLSLAQALADVATIGILQHRSHERSATLVAQLRLALNNRILVEQAKGILAEYGGVEMEVAFEALRTFARARRIKLSGVAQSLVARELDPSLVVDPRG